jgi:metallo-beta-lactamase class B
VIAEGQPIVLGDLKVTPVALPGHTPGAMGFIFPIKDNGRTRIAGLFGGTILTPGPISDEGLRTYAKSVAHFKDETRKAKAEIVFANHPLMDPVAPKLAKLAARKGNEPHPYVVGEANYQRFLDVIAGCTDVNLARRK